jgi:hypothetical protein
MGPGLAVQLVPSGWGPEELEAICLQHGPTTEGAFPTAVAAPTRVTAPPCAVLRKRSKAWSPWAPVSFRGLAHAANVSRSWLHRQDDLRAEPQRHRGQGQQCTAATTDRSATVESLRQQLHAYQKRSLA